MPHIRGVPGSSCGSVFCSLEQVFRVYIRFSRELSELGDDNFFLHIAADYASVMTADIRRCAAVS